MEVWKYVNNSEWKYLLTQSDFKNLWEEDNVQVLFFKVCSRMFILGMYLLETLTPINKDNLLNKS